MEIYGNSISKSFILAPPTSFFPILMAMSQSVTERVPVFKDFHFLLSYCTGAMVGT
jgi:hypothetical protein